MITRASPRRLAGLFGTVMLLGASTALAQPAQDPDWPCIQRLVPRVAAGAIWPGPPIEEGQLESLDDPEVQRLASQLAGRRTSLREIPELIDGFAAKLAPERREEMLTGLFVTALDDINRDRSSIVEGLKRSARKQQELADDVHELGVALRALPSNGTAEDEARRAELIAERDVKTRIFEERRHSLPYLCEQPVLLEQRAFELARQVAARLE